MLLPLFGFIIGCLIFGVIGVFLLKVLPSFKLTIINLSLFITGALIGALVTSIVYGWIVAGPDGQLDSKISVLAMFPIILVGGGFSGLVGVMGGRKILIALFPQFIDYDSKKKA